MSLYGVSESERVDGIRHIRRNRGERSTRLWTSPTQLELSQYTAMDCGGRGVHRNQDTCTRQSATGKTSIINDNNELTVNQLYAN